MKILIRDGSAARDFEDLVELISLHPDNVMFCSDDIHPDHLLREYINETCRKAISSGYEPLKVLRSATLNPVRHYGLDAGLLQMGDDADLVVLDSLENFQVRETYIKGELVAKNGKSLIAPAAAPLINNFNPSRKAPEDFLIPREGKLIHVIEAQER